jgi:Zn-dependent protease
MGSSRTSVPRVAAAARPAPRRGALTANAGLIAVVIKLAKSAKFLLLLASFAAYAVLLSWQASLILVFSLCCHEYGHVWAMRRRGVPTRGFYLIPFVGGLAFPARPFGRRSEEAFIASMGPVFGLLAAPLCFLLARPLTFSAPAAARLTEFVVFLNLFNLLPIVPLDGGRMVRACVASFSRPAGLVLAGLGVGAAVLLAMRLHAVILIWVAALAVLEIRAERQRGGSIAPLPKLAALGWIGAYLGIIAAGVVLMSVYGAIAGGPGLLAVLQRF